MSSELELQLVAYYFAYKDLVHLHRKFKFGDAPRTSEGFTEAICRCLFGFTKALQVGREYDLDDPKTNSRIEVKATTDDAGATTINPTSRFDSLYWLNFRLDINVLHVCVKDYSLFAEVLEQHKQEKRINITLSKFGDSSAKFFRFDGQAQAIVELSFDDYLKLIGVKRLA